MKSQRIVRAMLTHTDQVIADTDCGFTMERTYQATDLCSNSAFFVQTIDVIDYERPEDLNTLCSSNTHIKLEWDVDPGTAACQITGGIVGGAQVSIIKYAPNETEHYVPMSTLNANAQYQWKVRCACDLDPVTASTFSEYTYFQVSNLCDATAALTEGNDEVEGSLFATEKISMQIYPNPSSEESIIALNVNSDKSGVIAVYDILGNVVYRKSVDLINGNNQIRLDLQKYEGGTYLVEFTGAFGDKISERLVVIK